MTDTLMQLRGPEGQRLLEALRGVCLDLPGVSEIVDGFGHTTFKVGRKSFVIAGMGEAGTDVAIKCDPVTQSHLAGRRSFFRTPYIGHHGWISVANALAQDWSEVAELIVDGYRRAAPKRILARFDAEGAR